MKREMKMLLSRCKIGWEMKRHLQICFFFDHIDLSKSIIMRQKIHCYLEKTENKYHIAYMKWESKTKWQTWKKLVKKRMLHWELSMRKNLIKVWLYVCCVIVVVAVVVFTVFSHLFSWFSRNEKLQLHQYQ